MTAAMIYIRVLDAPLMNFYLSKNKYYGTNYL
jgi:hypothetical protein